MNIYAVGDVIAISGQLTDSRGPYNATGLTARAVIVLDDFSAAADGCNPVDIEWSNEGTGEYVATFNPDNTGTIVPGLYVLQVSVLLDTGKPLSWYTGAFEIRADNIDDT